MKKEQALQFTFTELTSENVDAADDMRRQSWLDTYVNEELGVTQDWIIERNQQKSTPESREMRKNQLVSKKTAGWVAFNDQGEVIGQTNPWVGDDGIQHVGSLYVDKRYHGKGIAGELMRRVIDWCDPAKQIELEVVSYNDRAKAFYRKWGFEEIPGSETLFADKIPEVKMIRKGDKQ